ncbi:polyprenyl synthetase family protein [Sedimentibacter sp. MB31-C6]|uniref:polyprenyl synthetase family protein n=1 Tax=Sedimentibacter sp. MB31-C6 TaxID=3109366 RepID=UPI002DDCD1C1|nr:farnesyl diphosphate synthase [Sedimentibacter sp. MB36-C1]WSI03775.1 farnesyl diphosphate synthase [Sedimentibacter sp. MB36-C1]
MSLLSIRLGIIMDFKQWFEEKSMIINNSLNEIFKTEENPQMIVYEAMNYSLLSGGKRLRPVLLLGAYEIFNEEIKLAMPFACAMEMIHTYSLIHDDLPAMDNDDYRRGRLSNHKVFGDATAILAGDALLNKAFEIGLQASIESNLNIKQAANALSIIANSSGTEGMIGGQIVDMFGHDEILNIEDLKYMYALKTGAIIKSSVVAGAILGGADNDEVLALEKYAENIGIAFQIVDDILDVTGTQEKIGKAVGSDKANNKITYLSFATIDKAKEHVYKYTEEAINSLSVFGENGRYLKELAKYLTKREY